MTGMAVRSSLQSQIDRQKAALEVRSVEAGVAGEATIGIGVGGGLGLGYDKNGTYGVGNVSARAGFAYGISGYLWLGVGLKDTEVKPADTVNKSSVFSGGWTVDGSMGGVFSTGLSAPLSFSREQGKLAATVGTPDTFTESKAIKNNIQIGPNIGVSVGIGVTGRMNFGKAIGRLNRFDKDDPISSKAEAKGNKSDKDGSERGGKAL